MQIKTLSVGQFQANCYLIWDENTRNCLIIDPGDEADFITEEILRFALHPQAILLTHGHYDHCLGCLEIKLNFDLPIYLNSKDNFLYQNASKSATFWSATKALKQPPTLPYPKTIKLGDETIKIISTPGHTPGSCCFLVSPVKERNGKAERDLNILFTGDTLFADTIGATNHVYSNSLDLRKSLKTLAKLPPETEIYPGHGESSYLETALATIS